MLDNFKDEVIGFYSWTGRDQCGLLESQPFPVTISICEESQSVFFLSSLFVFLPVFPLVCVSLSIADNYGIYD